MTRDEEIIQRFETKAGNLLSKAQQYLTTTLPGGPGIFTYVVMSNLVAKLFGNAREYVERTISRPLTLPDFVYVEPLDEELEVFFEDRRFKTLRAEFPSQYNQFDSDDWIKMRRYYRPLYYTFYYKDPFMVEMFSFEIQSQNYKRIILDYDTLPMYKQVLNSTPSAKRQNALWAAVNSILKETISEVWQKSYAKELFQEAKKLPEVAALVNKVKTKIRERVDIEELITVYNDIKYLTGRTITSETPAESEPPMKAVDFVTSVLPDGHIVVPAEMIKRFQLKTVSRMRVIVLQDEDSSSL